MTKNWAALNKAFQAESAKTGISVKAWCEKHNLNPNTARRHLKKKCANEKTNTRKNAQNKKPESKGSKGLSGGCGVSGVAQKTAQLDPPNLPQNAHFLKGAPDGNDNAKSHGFYAELMTEEEVGILARSSKVELEAELGLMRVRTVRAIKALTTISNDIDSADSVEQRTQLYEQYIRMEEKLDRAVQRIESITRTLADIQEKSVLLRLKAKKLDSSADKDLEQIQLIKKQVEEKGVIIDLRKNTAGDEKVTYEIDW